MAAASSQRRLPGVRFVTERMPPGDPLPRMDIPVFVGFAAQGELDKPTVVEDIGRFVETFGSAVPEEAGAGPGYLEATVRSFFNNGGRRCWIIRVGRRAGSDQAESPTSPDRRQETETERTLFLPEEALLEASTDTFMATARFLRYEGSGRQRELKGIYAALEIEEATMIAVPDALHCCWTQPEGEASVCSPHNGSSAEELDDEVAATGCPPESFFLDCRLPPRPALTAPVPDDTGSFTLSWKGGDDCSFRLQESVRLPETPPRHFSVQKLLNIHRALIRFCAARGDMTAVLSLPPDYREAETLEYLESLQRVESGAPARAPRDGKEAPGNPAGSGPPPVPPLAPGEERALSYAALFHPWLMTGRGGGELSAIPPDGAVCGMMAARALARGAWTAPANQMLRDVVALTPPIAEAARAPLAAAHVNLIARGPRGFTTLTADTLALHGDQELRLINVRRLLILIRKQAVRKGQEYVFEPHDPSFVRLVRRGFESMLDGLYMRGAFRGRTPEEAYQVATDGLNTRQSMEQGRFFVELKVAPSLPMSFLTIRLLQTSDSVSLQEVT